MDAQELKKFLAGLGIATLITGASLTVGGCASTGKSNDSGMGGSSQQAPAKSS